MLKTCKQPEIRMQYFQIKYYSEFLVVSKQLKLKTTNCNEFD